MKTITMIEFLDLKSLGLVSLGARKQVRVDFENAYTASIICNVGSYGLFEIAVLHNGVLDYNTPVTGDVIGNLDKEAVHEVCAQIKALPPKEVPLEIGITAH